MRRIAIIRPSNINVYVGKLKIFVDGVQVGVIANGGSYAAELDENPHRLRLQGGALAGKNFAAEIGVPAGSYSYCFQADVLILGGKKRPYIRPSNGSVLAESTGMITVMGIEITGVLLNNELRAALKQAPEARLGVVLEHDKWNLVFSNNGQLSNVASMPYKAYKGSFWQAGLSPDERDKLNTYEGKAVVLEMLFSEFLCMLPDYERTALDELRFKG